MTYEVLDGILYHSGFNLNSKKSFTLEGQVIKYAYKIAYTNHDIYDFIRAKLLAKNDIPSSIIKNLGQNY
ncbi:hypothetical protein [Clostridium ihumii]|uniref:hypothetical protein n=1 Tax=Clostridium ihumii TaxID=1470356 RepID=UPI003D33655C